MSKRLIVILTSLLVLNGCKVLYKMDINQGNLLSKSQVEQIKPGMSKRQIEVLVGTPTMLSPFDQDRWNYITSVSKRGGKPEIKNFALVFEGDALVRMEGEYFQNPEEELLETAKKLNRRGVERIMDDAERARLEKQAEKRRG